LTLSQLKQFDVGDIESLIGRYSHVEHGIKMDGLAYLRQFYNERSLHKRLAMIKLARKGGAVTPEAYSQLQPFIQSGQLQIRAHCQVCFYFVRLLCLCGMLCQEFLTVDHKVHRHFQFLGESIAVPKWISKLNDIYILIINMSLYQGD